MQKGNIENIYPLTPMQEGMLFHSLMENEQDNYFVQMAYRIEGELDTDHCKQVLQYLMDRHEMLRSAIVYEGVENPKLVILKQREADFRLVDYSDILNQDLLSRKLDQLKKEDRKANFHLTKDPLIRMTMVRLADKQFEFIWSFHHMIMDGWCMGILKADFLEIYRRLELGAGVAGMTPAVSYKRFMQWFQKQDQEKATTFWKGYLNGYTELASLPKAKQGRQGYYVEEMLLSEADCNKVEAFANKHQITLSQLVFSCWGILLSRYSNTNDVVFGKVVSGRPAEIPGVEQILGIFINTVPFRVQLDEGTTLPELLLKTREEDLASTNYHQTPLSTIQRQTQVGRELFNHIAVFENYPVGDKIKEMVDQGEEDGARLVSFDYHDETNYDFDLVIEKKNGLSVKFKYNQKEYDATLVRRVSRNFEQILLNLDTLSETPVSAWQIVTEEEKEGLLKAYKGPENQWEGSRLMHAMIEQQVAQTPNATAIVHRGERYSIGDTNARANQLAHAITGALEGKTGQFIPLHIERSADLFIAMLAVLKSGNAFIPVDPDWPLLRKESVLQTAEASLIISNQQSAAQIDEELLQGRTLLTTEDCKGEKEENLQLAIDPQSPAYCFFTSGSTGTPKGAVNAHFAVTNRLHFMTGRFDVQQGEGVLVSSNMVFDTIIWQLFWSISRGATAVIPENAKGVNLQETIELIIAEKISLIDFVPSLFDTFVDWVEETGVSDQMQCLRYVICGGEAIRPKAVSRFISRFPWVKVDNAYGPTETAISTIFYRVDKQNMGAVIPLGQPIPNVNILILDAQGNLTPRGVAGELWLGGACTGLGYLGDADKTAESFRKPSTWLPEGSVFYKTGDRVWLDDHNNIHFLGRNDYQVKVRGVRIEPAEIEQILATIDSINGVRVIVEQAGNGQSLLIAYFTAASKQDETAIHQEAKVLLPEYMMPTHFIQLDVIPVTENGKLDVAALPGPDKKVSQAGTVAPGSETEKLLADIWKQVLGLPALSIDDEFFALGGDSIKAIQIISRLHKAGYKLDLKKLFEYPTIRGLAPQLSKKAGASYETVSGEVPMLPIQQRFFGKELAKPEHYNQALMLELPAGMDETKVSAIFTALMNHHDQLRATFRKEGKNIVQHIPVSARPSITLMDWRDGSRSKEDIPAVATDIQAAMNLQAGPLMRLGLFLVQESSYLLIAVHHLVIDAVSWRILLEDLGALYAAVAAGKKPVLPSKTTSFKAFAERLKEKAQQEDFLQKAQYWEDMAAKETASFPVDANALQEVCDYDKVSLTLNETLSAQILREVSAAYGTEINDILLAGLMRAISESFGTANVLIDLEGHGREEIVDEADLSRTVGWFTSLYPVRLENHADNLRLITRTKETLRAVPYKGLSYGMYKYYSHGEKADLSMLSSQVQFNYLGDLSNSSEEGSALKVSAQGTGVASDARNHPGYALMVDGFFEAGKLQLLLRYHPGAMQEAGVQKLREAYERALQNIAAHCLGRKQRYFTPSDFPLASVQQEQLDALQQNYPVEDIYPLSAMQAGMLFHALADPKAETYFEQISYRLHGKLDLDILEKSINEVVARHEILRTVFIHEGISEPLQVVLRTLPADFRVVSRDQSFDTEHALLDHWRIQDRKDPFVLSKGSMVRLTVIPLGEDQTEVLWSHPHILMDGWCGSIIMQEMIACYQALQTGTTPQLPRYTPYKKFIGWLQEQDSKQAAHYWENYLSGYEELATLPQKKGDTDSYENRVTEFTIGGETIKGLRDLAHAHKTTVYSVLQTLWGILLARYNNAQDVVFGSVTSGRPADIPGVESIVGLFINTLPVRVKYDAETSFRSILESVQEHMLESDKHSYYQLAEIQAILKLQSPLINHFLDYANFPAGEELKRMNKSDYDLAITDVEVFEQTNYGLHINIIGGEEITFRFTYNASLYDEEMIRGIQHHLHMIAGQILDNPDRAVSQLELISAAEEQQLAAFNQTEADYAHERTIHSYLEHFAATTPHAPAIITDDRQLSYCEFNEEANRMAHVLRSKGVGPDSIVAVVLPRSMEMMLSIFAIIKAGGAYLPIDPAFPKDRISMILEDAAVELVCTSKALSKELPETLTFLHFEQEEVRTAAHTNPEPVAGPEDIAYVIYTSGSTGKPKGATIRHHSLINRVFWQHKQYGLSTEDTVLHKTTFTFDVSVWEIFWWSMVGSKVCLLAPGAEKDPLQIIDTIERHKASIMHFVPSMLASFLEVVEVFDKVEAVKSLRQVLVSGEALQVAQANLFDRLLRVNNGTRLGNLYGPTEATIDVSYYDLPEGEVEIVPIGKPVDNTQLYILSAGLKKQPVGIAGELCIAGVQLAREYLNRPQLTAEKFTDHPYEKGQKLYRTGDLARWMPDGNIEYLGRIDHQVKIRGYRIETGEIEKVILQQPHIEQAAVLAQKDQSGDYFLAGYYKSSAEVSSEALHEQLAALLPSYMIPAHLIALEVFPITHNGKLDRKALPVPGQKEEKNTIEPGSGLAAQLAQIWADVLNIAPEQISAQDSFFSIGGNSIKVISVVSKIKQDLGIDLPITACFEHPTLAALSQHISSLGGTGRLSAKATTQRVKRQSNDIAIIGMGMHFPTGKSPREFWQALAGGVDGIKMLSDDELRAAGVPESVIQDPKYIGTEGGYVEDKLYFDADFFQYSPIEAEIMHPQARLLHQCIWHALEDAAVVAEGSEQRIGLFAGGSHDFMWEAANKISGKQQMIGDFASMPLVEKDYLVTLIAHRLQLTGPAISVHTACSTSLVAVHNACQSILNGECEMALAGGTAIKTREYPGYTYQEGMIGSADGRCRAYDNEANGAIHGEGAGVVLLKSLDQAIADGDPIRAVIKGSAINNDGNRKIGYTAPSVQGQVEVIAAAQQAAGVTPEQITYVEGHGTGTTLGDPIELEALRQAFATDKKGFCGIGSVKTNIGHLDTAAGVAGLIKTTLALQHKTLVPSLNFTTPTQKFDFANSPFYVNNELQEWTGKGPLRAGVSSFGIGGTNAHVVIEEAPVLESSAQAPHGNVLLISAKTTTALDTLSSSYQQVIEEASEEVLASIAYTLQRGRKPLSKRRAIAYRDKTDLLQKMQDPASWSQTTALETASPVFLFSGQGAQYAHMAADLYTTEPGFRSVIDDCFNTLAEHSTLNFKAALFPQTEEEAALINQTAYTQPLLFVVEYALAKQLMTQGVQPVAMMGHSVGEYVAATIAQVISLKDALRLICLRGALMQALPAGQMLSVSATEAEVKAALKGLDIDFAAINSPKNCVLSGDAEVIAEAIALLDAAEINNKVLKTSHAFHSRMMDPALGEFRAALAGIRFAAPQMPYVSNLTGQWITAEQAGSADYWVSHLREAVRFADGIALLAQDKHAVFIEIGPGKSLCTLAKNTLGANARTVNLLRHPEATVKDSDFYLQQIGLLWAQGIRIDWEMLYKGDIPRRMALPGYPFEGKRFGIDRKELQQIRKQLNQGGTSRSEMQDWFYQPVWQKHTLTAPALAAQRIVFLHEAGEEDAALLQHLQSQATELVTVNDKHTDLATLLASHIKEGEVLIVYGWDRTNGNAQAQADSFLRLCGILREAGKTNAGISLCILSTHAFDVTGAEGLQVAPAVLQGLVRSMAQEYPEIRVHLLDSTVADLIASQELLTLLQPVEERILALRGRRVWKMTVEEVTGTRLSARAGTYLLIGGASQVGMSLAKGLAVEGANLIFTSREKYPARVEWEIAIAQGHPLAGKLSKLLALEQQGASVRMARADVTDLESLKTLVENTRSHFGGITGIVYAAGVVNTPSANTPLAELTGAMLQEQWDTKVTGVNNLKAALGGYAPAWVLLTSSLSTLLGGLGYGAYAAANAYLDAFATAENIDSTTRWIATDFDGWTFDEQADAGNAAIRAYEGEELISYLLGTPHDGQLIVSTLPLAARLQHWMKPQGQEDQSLAEDMAVTERPELPQVYVAVDGDLESKLEQLWRQLFGYDRIGRIDNFFDLGGDSLRAVGLINQIQKLGVDISLSDFFRDPTISAISAIAGQGKGSAGENTIPPAAPAAHYPTSPAQRRLYFLQELEPSNTAYNQVSIFQLTGAIAPERMHKACKSLIDRFELFRTAVKMVDNAPVQVILNEVPDVFAFVEDSTFDPAQLPAAWTAAFDFEQPPLMRVVLVKKAEDTYYLFLNIHHVLTDGVSQQLILKELLQGYQDASVLEVPQLQYKDYAAWLQEEDQQEKRIAEKEYWTAKLSEGVEPLQLPTDFERPAVRDTRGDTFSVRLNAEETARLREVAREQGVTTYMFILAVYQLWLMRLSGQSSVCVGTPVLGRQHADLSEMIGMFVNSVVVKGEMHADISFADYLQQVKTTALEAFDNQGYPFEELVEALGTGRDTSRNPIFDVVYAHENFVDNKAQKQPQGDWDIAPVSTAQHIAKYDLTLVSLERQDSLQFNIEYATALFSKETVTRFIAYFSHILQQVIHAPAGKVADLQLLNEQEQEAILTGFNPAPVAYPVQKDVAQLFAEQVRESKDSEAIVYHGESLSYATLNQKANVLAHKLIAEGVNPGDRVALLAAPSLEYVAGILAIAKAGAAYVPVDTGYPAERQEFILSDSAARLVLAQTGRALACSTTLPIVEIAVNWEGNGENPDLRRDAEDLLYIMYTSGSTGTPKGVMIPQRGAVRLVKNNTYFPLNVQTRILQTGAPVFDATTFEVWGPLLNGGTLVLADKDELIDARRFAEVIAENKVNGLWMSAPYMAQIFEQESQAFTGITHLIAGGDVINPAVCDAIIGTHPQINLINAYGPTENTTFSTTHLIRRPVTGSVPIGKPIANSSAVILDSWQNMVPVGVVGELYVGGPGLALGYLNQTELSAEKFVNHPFIEGEKLYRTGDLASWSAEGNIHFVGRADFQVKIRGYRVEPGEIENKIAMHGQVTEVIVTVTQGAAKELCAYYVSDETLSPAELRAWLQEELPAYMVPAYMVRLDALPLNVNNKVDRKALPAPEEVQQAEGRMPESEQEIRLAAIWAEVLKLEQGQIGAEQNFFEIGGQSLKATLLAAKIREQLQQHISLIDLFKNTTIASQAKLLAGSNDIEVSTIVKAPEQEHYPLSSAQRRLWFIDKLMGPNRLYNMPVSIALDKSVSAEQIEKVFRLLAERHETLRTSFAEHAGEPVQVIHEQVDIHIEQVYTLNDDVEAAMQGFVRHFDLSKAPLFRIGFLETAEHNYLFFDIHHAVSDGVSLTILREEVNALLSGQSLPALDWQYKDFAWSQQETDTSEHKNYWLEQFQGEIPVLQLPEDHERPAIRQHKGGRKTFRWQNKEQIASFRTLASQEEATPYMVLLTAYYVLLSRLGNQEDVVVGTPVAGRQEEAWQGLVGMFVNTLPLRSEVQGTKTFRQLLAQVRTLTIDALSHQSFQYEDLLEELDVKRATNRNPLFDAFFALRNVFDSAEVEAGEANDEDTNAVIDAKFDLELTALETKNGFSFLFDFAADIYTPESISQWSEYYLRVIEAVTSNPDLPVGEIDLLSTGEEARLAAFSERHTPRPEGTALPQELDKAFDRYAKGEALRFGPEVLSYEDLGDKVDTYGAWLQQMGIGRGQQVGILMNRSTDMLIAILAVLKAGASYLPVEPKNPHQRVQSIIDEARPVAIIAHAELIAPLDYQGLVFKAEEIQERLSAKADTATEVCSEGSDLAYTIYTSGSTGVPKGVDISHDAVLALRESLSREIDFVQGQSILVLTSISFDIFIVETLIALMKGMRLVLVDDEAQIDSSLLGNLLEEHQVDVLQCTPSRMRLILNEPANKNRLGKLTTVMLGGEAFSNALLDEIKAATEARIFNIYGPTEITVYATIKELTDCDEILIGHPLANFQARITNKQGHLQPFGVPGELLLAGPQLARGYANDPVKTGNSFINLPSSEERWYKTGDLVKWTATGEIEYLGRIDDQVKIRGYRVEIGEVEAAIASLEQVQDLVITVQKDNDGETFMAAYIVTNEEVDLSALRRTLLSKVPDYMVPSAIITVPKIPVNQNGKVDKSALPSPQTRQATSGPVIPPSTELQEALVDIWKEVLQLQEVSIDASFFEIGGHSLKATRLVYLVNSRLQKDLSVREVFVNPTIEMMATLLENKAGSAFGEIQPVGEQESYEMSSAQERLYFLNQLDKQSISYNMPVHYELIGEFDVDQIEETFRLMINRHEALRTSFIEREQGPVQVIVENPQFSMLRLSAQDEKELHEHIAAFVRPFELSKAPLMRVGAVQMPDRVVLLTDKHHIISDGTSEDHFIRDFFMLYQQGAAVAPLPLQYKDYAAWQKGFMQTEHFQKQERYWFDKLQDVDPLDLPLDFKRPEVFDFKGAFYDFELDETASKAVFDYCQERGISLYMFLLATYNVLLYRYSGQNDILVGTGVAGRRHEQVQQMIGLFVNMLVMRNEVDESLRFEDFMGAIKTSTLEAFDNQDIQFEHIVDRLGYGRDLSRNPIFNVGLVVQNFAQGQIDPSEQTLEQDGRRVSSYKQSGYRNAKFDLTLFASEQEGRIHLAFEYATSLFKEETVARMAGHLTDIIKQVLEQQEVNISQLQLNTSYTKLESGIDAFDFDF